MKHIFPKELYIAYAICDNCNNKEFIVDGQSQICNQCGELLSRREVKLYTLEKEENINMKIGKNKISFPEEIIVAYTTCEDALNGEEIVAKDKVICQKCEK